jgi:integrase
VLSNSANVTGTYVRDAHGRFVVRANASDITIRHNTIYAYNTTHHQDGTSAISRSSGGRRRPTEKARKAWHSTPLVFTTRCGTPIEPRNFNRYWDRRCDAAQVRRINVHDARRTCGSLLADLDVHPQVAMQILRHAQFSITMEIYTQVSSQATRDALKRLGESLGQ